MAKWTEEFIAAWNAHDAEAITSFMTADASFHHWGDDEWGVYRGRDEIVRFIDWLNTNWSSDYQLNATLSLATDSAFAIEYVETGTADLGDHAPDRRFNLRSVFVGELAQGKITRITDYADMSAYAIQMRAVEDGK